MSRFNKALTAAVLAAAGSLAAVLPGGVELFEWVTVVLTTVVTGLGAAGVSNAGFVDLTKLGPVADLARAAYTEYREQRGGVAYDGSPIPTWENVETTIRDAWIAGQKAALEN